MPAGVALGGLAYNTLWEVPRPLSPCAPGRWSSVRTPRSWCASAASVFASLAARRAGDSGLNRSLQDMSLDACIYDGPISALVHIPGVSNVVTDGLSRMCPPEPKPLPLVLARCPRYVVDVRARAFDRVPPCSVVRVRALA